MIDCTPYLITLGHSEPPIEEYEEIDSTGTAQRYDVCINDDECVNDLKCL